MAEKAKKDPTIIRRDFSAIVLDLYGDPAFIEREQALARALKRFADEAPADALALFNRIFKEEGRKELTLGNACAEALGGAYEDEKGMNMETRVKRFKLAQKVLEGGIQEITTDERTQIQALIVKRYPGSVLAPACSIMLETEPEEQAAPETA